jgi:uncharacterized protein (UPF0248 family)
MTEPRERCCGASAGASAINSKTVSSETDKRLEDHRGRTFLSRVTLRGIRITRVGKSSCSRLFGGLDRACPYHRVTAIEKRQHV